MSNPQTDQSNHKRLRLWPGLALLVVQLIAWFLVPLFFPKLAIFGVFAGIICALLIALWWLFFSRARWIDRLHAGDVLWSDRTTARMAAFIPGAPEKPEGARASSIEEAVAWLRRAVGKSEA